MELQTYSFFKGTTSRDVIFAVLDRKGVLGDFLLPFISHGK